MFLHSGYKYDRFGEEVESSGDVDTKLVVLKKEFSTGVKSMFFNLEKSVDSKLLNLQKEFSSEAKTQFDRVKNELLDRAKVQVDFQPSYITVKNKRIVSLSDGIDATDAVNKKQLMFLKKLVNFRRGLKLLMIALK